MTNEEIVSEPRDIIDIPIPAGNELAWLRIPRHMSQNEFAYLERTLLGCLDLMKEGLTKRVESQLSKDTLFSDGWISIEEQLPETLHKVMLFDTEYGVLPGYVTEDDDGNRSEWREYGSMGRELDYVTHWRPFEERPKR